MYHERAPADRGGLRPNLETARGISLPRPRARHRAIILASPLKWVAQAEWAPLLRRAEALQAGSFDIMIVPLAAPRRRLLGRPRFLTPGIWRELTRASGARSPAMHTSHTCRN